jgi:hypothetical protein
MTSTTTGVTQVANFTPEVWATECAKASENAAVIAPRVNRRLEKVMKMGDTVHVPTLSNLTANTKSANTAVDWQAITETVTDVSVQTQKYTAMLHEDIGMIQANQDTFELYSKKAAYPLRRAIEVGIAAIFDGLSQTSGSAGVEFVWDDFVYAFQLVNEAGLMMAAADPDNDFSWFLSPAAWAGCLKLDVFINGDYGSKGAVASGKVNTALGAPVFMSNLLESDATGQHDNAFFHRDQFVLVEQEEPKVESDRIIEHIGDAMVAHTIYGFAEMGFPPEAGGGGAAVDTRGVLMPGK